MVPPYFIELASLNDLGRLACAFEKIPLPIFVMNLEGKQILATQMDVFMGAPIFYYKQTNTFNHFLGYKNSNGLEEVILTNSTINPTYIYAPIIVVKEIPSIFKQGWRRRRGRLGKFIPMQVSDLINLAKVCSYKMLYDEPPIPLFLFQNDKYWNLGALTRMDEYDECSFYFYIKQESQPIGNFLKYSPSKVSDTQFTNHVDEHGYIYIKIIQLAKSHPLVKLKNEI